ncbi:MAG: NAD-dependent epimerase/dehydratase family protein [Angustibacter sp.]
MSSAAVGAGNAGSRPVVAVVGAATPVGAAVCRALIGVCPGQVADVVAVDDRRGSVDLPWRVGPLDDPSVVARLRGADVVVHACAAEDLGALLTESADERRSRLVRSAQAVATAAAAVGARRLLAITSAMVLGAAPDNPVPLLDDASPSAVLGDGVVGDLIEVERVWARVPGSHPGLALTVLRPAALVGEGVDTVMTRHFEAPRLLYVRDAETRWQFCHVDDLAAAVVTAVVTELTGSLTVGCEGWLNQDDVERLSGMRRVEVPVSLAFSTAQRLHRLGLLPTPASDLAYVVHPWVVSAKRLQDAGWRPRHDNADCLRLLLGQVRGRYAVAARRFEHKDAALRAAGAAVALVGTAAVVRRRRRRT